MERDTNKKEAIKRWKQAPRLSEMKKKSGGGTRVDEDDGEDEWDARVRTSIENA